MYVCVYTYKYAYKYKYTYINVCIHICVSLLICLYNYIYRIITRLMQVLQFSPVVSLQYGSLDRDLHYPSIFSTKTLYTVGQSGCTTSRVEILARQGPQQKCPAPASKSAARLLMLQGARCSGFPSMVLYIIMLCFGLVYCSIARYNIVSYRIV